MATPPSHKRPAAQKNNFLSRFFACCLKSQLGADLSTGLFLDQRLQRNWLRTHLGPGDKLLNCFAHAGGYSGERFGRFLKKRREKWMFASVWSLQTKQKPLFFSSDTESLPLPFCFLIFAYQKLRRAWRARRRCLWTSPSTGSIG